MWIFIYTSKATSHLCYLRWQVIDIPTGGDLHKSSRFTFDQRMHPLLGFFRIVYLRPRVSYTEPIHLTIVMGHRVVVLDSIAKKKFSTLLGGFPPRSNTPSWRLPAEVCEEAISFVEHITLLFQGHIRWILV
jgi:hypothetical protein